MKDTLIYGIQQIGIGVDDAAKAFEFYATRLGSDVPVFDDIDEATFMAPYMGGKAHRRRAILAINMQGGGGYEIWQFLDREPKRAEKEFHLGDLGINLAKVKSRNISQSFGRLQNLKVNLMSGIVSDPGGINCFYLRDPFDNIIQIRESSSWYNHKTNDTGGVSGCMIGVSEIESSLKLYSDILGYNKMIYDYTNRFIDLKSLPNGEARFRRVLLGHEGTRTGGFSKLLGESQIELIQCLDTAPVKVYQDRFWGDIGYIHLCFDVRNLGGFADDLKDKGFPFRVLSEETFEMGDASGRWGYFEDPDGTLIEFVETYRIPLVKALKWSINMKRRDPAKSLPDWLIRSLSLKRVKFNKAETNVH
jgi:catechol 2,3-dioxygenase-like lactoylglutathione lyase family enzyme